MEAFIMAVLIACGLMWVGAHAYDNYQEKRRRQARDHYRRR